MSQETDGEDRDASGGLFSSARTMAATLVAIVQTRAELLSTELEEERIRLTSLLVWMLATLFCAGLAVIFVTLLLMLALWEDHRMLAVTLPAVVFSLAAFFCWRVVSTLLRSKPRLFSASLAELAKDHDQLTPEP